MMRNVRHILVTVACTAALTVLALGQTADPLADVCAASEQLTAYTATIRMLQHQAGDVSEIEFTFDFVPPDRMRIVYTAPATVEGQTMILNADKFYTYIPSLHRSVWQDVGEGGGNQGEEMGFLYDYVTRSATAALEQAEVHETESSGDFVLESTGEILDVIAYELATDGDRQIVLIHVQDAAPVAISIYSGEDLVMEIYVLEYQMNGDFDDAWFEIPEK